MIERKNLTKPFGDFTAADYLNLLEMHKTE
jgi:hypothetical protein